MIKIWDNQCLICDHTWISNGYAVKCRNCNETNDIHSNEANEDTYKKVYKAKELWKELSNIPVDDDDYIETAWHIFYKGTPKLDIWHWFESKFNLSIQDDLMGTEHEE